MGSVGRKMRKRGPEWRRDCQLGGGWDKVAERRVTSVTGIPWLQHEGAWLHPASREQKSHRPVAGSLASLSVCRSGEGGGQRGGTWCGGEDDTDTLSAPPDSSRAVLAMHQDWGWEGDGAGGP